MGFPAIITIAFLLALACGACAAEPNKDIAVGARHARQQECSQEMLNTMLDPMCLQNLNLLDILGSHLATVGRLATQDEVNQLADLASKVCTDTCFGVLYTNFNTCLPETGSEDLERDMRIALRFCSSNGETFCGLSAYFGPSDDEILNFYACLSEWRNDGRECPSQCTAAYEAVMDEIGCCSNNLAEIFYEEFGVANTGEVLQGFYFACDIEDTEPCPLTTSQQNNGIAAAIQGITVVTALMTAVLTVL